MDIIDKLMFLVEDIVHYNDTFLTRSSKSMVVKWKSPFRMRPEQSIQHMVDSVQSDCIAISTYASIRPGGAPLLLKTLRNGRKALEKQLKRLRTNLLINSYIFFRVVIYDLMNDRDVISVPPRIILNLSLMCRVVANGILESFECLPGVTPFQIWDTLFRTPCEERIGTYAEMDQEFHFIPRNTLHQGEVLSMLLDKHLSAWDLGHGLNILQPIRDELGRLSLLCV